MGQEGMPLLQCEEVAEGHPLQHLELILYLVILFPFRKPRGLRNGIFITSQ